MSQKVFNMPNYKHYDILETIYSGRSRVVRAFDNRNGKTVIIKIAANKPTPIQRDAIKEEFELFSSVYENRASLEEMSGDLLFVMDDFNGEALSDHALIHHFTLLQKLQLFKKIIAELEHIHSKNIIHKDINPYNIILNSQTEDVQIIDFNIASKRNNEVIHAADTITGTLAYISPEQTGRTNNPVDFRSDYYSLGATFYELLTFTQLYSSIDPLELIHAHLAQKPREITSVPRVLSHIIHKLLEKDPLNRYQSLSGITSDIDKCISELSLNGTIPDFAIAEDDVKSLFAIPQKLYGRANEIEFLQDSMEHLQNDENCLTLIQGKSGIGKTAIVNELYISIIEQNGFLIKGKFQQLHKSTPYSAFLEALKGIIAAILSESRGSIKQWKQDIINEIGDNTALLSMAIPELENLVGKFPPPVFLDPESTKNRFYHTITSFIKLFTKNNRSVVIFLDDIQWIDQSSLDLMEELLIGGNTERIMLICSIRSNAQDENKSLRTVISAIEKLDKCHVSSLTLNELSEDTTSEIIADTLHTSSMDVMALNMIIYQKTRGNPFFVHQLLTSLYCKGFIRFEGKSRKWAWDLEEIKQLQITDNVVELMHEEISTLSTDTIMLLKIASIIGSKFSLGILHKIFPQLAGKESLSEAIRKEFIISLGNSVAANHNSKVDYEFMFAHDKIKEAAYAMVTPEESLLYHQKIGEYYLNLNTHSGNTSDELIYKIVEHLNKTVTDSYSDIKIAELLKLNLQAAERAKRSAAFENSLHFLHFAESIISDNFWENHYSEMLVLTNELADVTLQLNQIDEMERYLERIVDQSRSTIDQMTMIRIKVSFLNSQDKPHDSVALALAYIKKLGLTIPQNPNSLNLLFEIISTKIMVGTKTKADLLALPVMSNPDQLAIMKTLGAISAASYLTSPKLFLIIGLIQVKLSIKHGNSDASAHAYSLYGIILSGIIKDYESSYKFAEIANDLSSKFDKNSFHGRILFHSANFIRSWKEPFINSLGEVKSAYKEALNLGDFEYASWAQILENELQFYTGSPLPEVLIGFEKSKKIATQFKQLKQEAMSHDYYQMIISLINGSECVLFNTTHAQRLQQQLANDDFVAVHLHYTMKAIVQLFEQKFTDANDSINQASKYIQNNMAATASPVFHFYNAIIKLNLQVSSQNKKKRSYLTDAKKSCHELKKIATRVPENAKHKYEIVKAMLTFTSGNNGLAFQLFDNAIELSEKSGYIQDAAIASEIAARYYFSCDQQFVGEQYLKRAYNLYTSWGAEGISNLLAKEFPQHLDPSSELRTETSIHPSDFVDSATLQKATSLIAKEINLEKFLRNMMKIVIQNCGADRGILLLQDGGEIFVEAIADMANVDVLQHIPYEIYSDVPESIINRVIFSRVAISVENAQTESTYRDEEYIQNSSVKSILALPLHFKNEIAGVLYLENSLTEGIFNRKTSVELLTMLTSEIVISLENARLYTNLESRNRELEISVKSAKKLAIKAQESDKVKAQFLSNLSHELRTPVNGIVGIAHLLDDDTLTELQKNHITTLKETTDDFLVIIDKILDFAEIDSGTLTFTSAPFNLRTILKSVTDTLKASVDTSRIRIKTTIDPETPCRIIADSHRIKQAMSSLVENAVKFTTEGLISLRIDVLSQTEDKCELKFTVQDTGIGIDTQNIAKLFQSFSQQDGSTTRTHGGLGLGLTVAKEIVSRMNGDIGATNASETGAIFWFNFTVERDLSGSIEQLTLVNNNQPQSTESSVGTQEGLKTAHILIVDDNDLNRLIIQKLVEKFGCTTETAENGKVALSKVQESQFNLILMDCQMPVMDGYEATNEIRTNTDLLSNRTIPIVAITANAMPGDKVKCINAGMDDYLSKPINSTDLIKVLKKYSCYS